MHTVKVNLFYLINFASFPFVSSSIFKYLNTNIQALSLSILSFLKYFNTKKDKR